MADNVNPICYALVSKEATDTSEENGSNNSVSQRPGICVKYFLSLPQKNLSLEKTETNYVFTFPFFNDEIDKNTKFAKLPSAKWLF